jgi:hypothetical protein
MNRLMVGLAVMGFGVAVATLAGVPLFLPDHVAGGIVMIAGFGLVLGGAIIACFGIPEFLAAKAERRRGREADIERLRFERDQLYADKIEALSELAVAMKHLDVATDYGDQLRAGSLRAGMQRIKARSAHVERQLGINASEFKRYGLEPESHGD